MTDHPTSCPTVPPCFNTHTHQTQLRVIPQRGPGFSSHFHPQYIVTPRDKSPPAAYSIVLLSISPYHYQNSRYEIVTNCLAWNNSRLSEPLVSYDLPQDQQPSNNDISPVTHSTMPLAKDSLCPLLPKHPSPLFSILQHVFGIAPALIPTVLLHHVNIIMQAVQQCSDGIYVVLDPNPFFRSGPIEHMLSETSMALYALYVQNYYQEIVRLCDMGFSSSQIAAAVAFSSHSLQYLKQHADYIDNTLYLLQSTVDFDYLRTVAPASESLPQFTNNCVPPRGNFAIFIIPNLNCFQTHPTYFLSSSSPGASLMQSPSSSMRPNDQSPKTPSAHSVPCQDFALTRILSHILCAVHMDEQEHVYLQQQVHHKSQQELSPPLRNNPTQFLPVAIYAQTYGYITSDIQSYNKICAQSQFPSFYRRLPLSDNQISVDPFYDALHTLQIVYPELLRSHMPSPPCGSQLPHPSVGVPVSLIELVSLQRQQNTALFHSSLVDITRLYPLLAQLFLPWIPHFVLQPISLQDSGGVVVLVNTPVAISASSMASSSATSLSKQSTRSTTVSASRAGDDSLHVSPPAPSSPHSSRPQAPSFQSFYDSPVVLPYRHMCLGGTFDHLHTGHLSMLYIGAVLSSHSFILGVTSPAMLVKKQLASYLQPWPRRVQHVLNYIALLKGGYTYRVHVPSSLLSLAKSSGLGLGNHLLPPIVDGISPPPFTAHNAFLPPTSSPVDTLPCFQVLCEGLRYKHQVPTHSSPWINSPLMYSSQHYAVVVETLVDMFGPSTSHSEVQCLVVSEEVKAGGRKVNAMRQCIGYQPSDLIVVPLVQSPLLVRHDVRNSAQPEFAIVPDAMHSTDQRFLMAFVQSIMDDCCNHSTAQVPSKHRQLVVSHQGEISTASRDDGDMSTPRHTTQNKNFIHKENDIQDNTAQCDAGQQRHVTNLTTTTPPCQTKTTANIASALESNALRHATNVHVSFQPADTDDDGNHHADDATDSDTGEGSSTADDDDDDETAKVLSDI